MLIYLVKTRHIRFSEQLKFLKVTAIFTVWVWDPHTWIDMLIMITIPWFWWSTRHAQTHCMRYGLSITGCAIRMIERNGFSRIWIPRIGWQKRESTSKVLCSICIRKGKEIVYTYKSLKKNQHKKRGNIWMVLAINMSKINRLC
jgi:hypothetical protein